MTLGSVLVGATLSAFLLSGNFYYSNIFLNKVEIKLENNNMDALREAVINHYNITGVLPSSPNEAKNFMTLHTSSDIKDRFKEPFEFMKNTDGSGFSFKGSSPMYKIAIVSMGGNKTLDTTLLTNVLTIPEDEKAILISEFDLMKSERGETLRVLKQCSAASAVYNASPDTVSYPSSVYDLLAEKYLEPKNMYDSFGNILLVESITGKCYSVGYNGLSGTAVEKEDDIVLN